MGAHRGLLFRTGLLGMLAAFAMLTMTAGSASASVILSFTQQLDGSIHLGGTDTFGNPINVTKPNSQTFHISSPVVPFGYTPDAILSHIGISQTSSGYLVDILQRPGGPVAAQVFVHQFIPQFTVIDFVTDPTQFFGGPPTVTVVATGGLQNVFNYNNDRGEPVSINAQLIPEPASLAVFGIIGICIGGYSWQRRKAQMVNA